MAKKPTTAAKAAPASVALPLPPELLELLSAASVAAITAARAAAEAEAKPGDEAAAAAATAAAELLVKASEAIDTWFVSYVAARLATADTEAERQLEEKRATLKTLLEELDARSSELTERRARVDAELAAFVNAPAPEETSPAAIPEDLRLADGMEMITVIGPAAGLRRAGHLFNAVPNTVVVTAEQKALIAADPALSITDDPSPEAELASRLGEKPAASAFVFDPNGYTDVKVLGPKGGRRRIGHSFGPEESIVRVDASELEELLADNLLAVGQA